MSVVNNVVDNEEIFEKALNVWSSIDLSNLQKELDDKAIEIQEIQKNSLLSRKELAKETKVFKKLQDDCKINEFNKLLKLYQNEIDNVNKKNKNIENLFFKIYRSIADAPDPKPLLRLSLDFISKDNELKKVKEENIKLEEKLINYSDYDNLQNKFNNLESQLNKVFDEKLIAKDNELKELLEEKENNWIQKDLDKDNMIQNMQKQIDNFQINEKMLKLKLKRKSQALGETDEDDYDEEDKEEVNTDIKSNDDIKIKNLENEIDNSQRRVKSLETRNEELRREVSLSKSNINIEIEKIKQVNIKELNNLEGENSLLIAKIEHERKINNELKTEIVDTGNKFKRDIKQLNFEIENLKKFKQNSSDYEDIKKELEILKQIQFGDFDDEDDNKGSGNGNEVGNSDETDEKLISNNESSTRIESAIVQRNKKLNNDLIELRINNDKLNNEIAQLNDKVKNYESEVTKLQKMNSKLEDNLLNFENESNSINNNDDKWETMSMISSIAGGNNTNNTNNNNGKISPALSIAGGSVIMDQNKTNSKDSSILPVITQQRDRFRKKNKELEDENKKQFSKVIELKREINSLKTDNRELYEKIRFLEYHQNSSNNSIGNKHGNDIESRYMSDYENDLHPIEQFRIMETKRINSKITPWDRIFIQITKTVLSTQLTRWLFVAYCCSLHLLIMMLILSLMDTSRG